MHLVYVSSSHNPSDEPSRRWRANRKILHNKGDDKDLSKLINNIHKYSDAAALIDTIW